MKRETEVFGVTVRIDEADDKLCIGLRNGGYIIPRRHAPELISFIQQWLDHDPERELVVTINNIRADWSKGTDDIIAAVREHDAKYRT